MNGVQVGEVFVSGGWVELIEGELGVVVVELGVVNVEVVLEGGIVEVWGIVLVEEIVSTVNQIVAENPTLPTESLA